MTTLLKQFKRCFSDNEARLRIGSAVRTIPEEFGNFFKSKKVLNDSVYDSKLKLFLHLNGTVLLPPSLPPSSSNEEGKVLLVEGKKDTDNFLDRLRVLIKWGHLYWRLSDLSALKLEPQRVIKPESFKGGDVEMKIHWQMKVDGDAYFIEGPVSLKSLYQVQYQRFFPADKPPQARTQTVLYTGINRYIFSGRTGLCKELHVDRIEPKISKNILEWKWKWRIAATCE
jgi:hypothetical protein